VNSAVGTPAERRKALIDRSDRERAELAAIFGGPESKLAVVETVVATARRVHRHRLLVGAAGLLMILAPLAARSWVRRILWLVPVALEGFRVVRAFGDSRRASSTTNTPGVRP